MSTFIITLRRIGPLTLALTIALLGNFAYSAWSNPTVAPTGGNVPAPINVGGSSQVKSGNLTVNNLITNAGLSVAAVGVFNPINAINEGGEIVLKGAGTNQDVRLDNNNGTFRVFRSGYELFKVTQDDKVAARKYCDINGNNCFEATDVGGVTGICSINSAAAITPGGCNSAPQCPSNYVAVGGQYADGDCGGGGSDTYYRRVCMPLVCN